MYPELALLLVAAVSFSNSPAMEVSVALTLTWRQEAAGRCGAVLLARRDRPPRPSASVLSRRALQVGLCRPMSAGPAGSHHRPPAVPCARARLCRRRGRNPGKLEYDERTSTANKRESKFIAWELYSFALILLRNLESSLFDDQSICSFKTSCFHL